MLSTGIIVFREAVEAALIVSIVLAATRGVPGRGRVVSLGVAGGVLGACVIALFAGSIADAFEGSGQELLNAAVLAVAVVMLTWHVVWMARHGREMAAEMRSVGQDVAAGRRPLGALAVVVGVAVLREGAEVALFLYGIAAGGGTDAAGMAGGGVVGLLAGVALCWLAYLGLVRLPMGRLFQVTGWLVTLLAAGLASQAAHFLQSAGWIDALSRTAWNSSAILDETSLLGRMLHTLVGYSDRPSELQVVVYLATLVTILVLARLAAPKRDGLPRGVRPAA